MLKMKIIHLESIRISSIALATCIALSNPLTFAFARSLEFDDLVTWATMRAYAELCSYDKSMILAIKAFMVDVKKDLYGLSEEQLQKGFMAGLDTARQDLDAKKKQFGEIAAKELFCIRGKEIFSSKILPYLLDKYSL